MVLTATRSSEQHRTFVISLPGHCRSRPTKSVGCGPTRRPTPTRIRDLHQWVWWAPKNIFVEQSLKTLQSVHKYFKSIQSSGKTMYNTEQSPHLRTHRRTPAANARPSLLWATADPRPCSFCRRTFDRGWRVESPCTRPPKGRSDGCRRGWLVQWIGW